MYLKATIQKVTDFGYFANFGREQTFEQSNWNFSAQTFFLTIILSIFFITYFILIGCGMVDKICGGQKKKIYR
jgi:hypothetical protein